MGESGGVRRRFDDIGIKNVSLHYELNHEGHVGDAVRLGCKMAAWYKANQDDNTIYHQAKGNQISAHAVK